MTERCKRNPCCGDYLDCKPPQQFKPRESYGDYQRRTEPTDQQAAARAAVERLANVQMNISLAEWSELSSTILAALAKPASSPAGDVDEILEYVRTSYRMDIMRLRECGLQTAQADDAIARIDAALSQSTSGGRVGE